MKFVVAAAFLGCASAVAAQNVVQMDLNRRAPGQGAPIINRRLGKRATYTEILANNLTGGGYYAVVDVGTPGQQMSMVLDTGSSDAWVVNYKADLCTSLKLQEYYGDSCWETYNPADSSTFQEVDRGGFVITYIDGGGASGDYIKDTFSIGGMTIKGLQMGMANKTVRGSGILGIGFDAGEAASAVYPNLIDQMVSQGLVSAKAYSLYLNDRRTSSGTILFGGFDTEKFIGELQVLPILKSTAGSYTAFAVAMSGLSISYANGSTENILTAGDSLPAVLDSGTTLSYLPDDVTAAIVSQLDAYTDERETGLTFINCDYLTSSSSLFFTMAFGSSATITVPAIEMVLDVLDGYTGELPPGIPFNNVCLFGLQGSGSISSQGGGGSAQAQDFALLGDTFLRSAYVVYDLDSAQIGIAQANLNSSDTDIVEIGASDKSIPSASGVASQQTTETAAPAATTGSSTGTGQGSGQVTVTVTPSQSPTKNAAAVARPGGSSAQGPAVMAITGLFALFGGAIFAL